MRLFLFTFLLITLAGAHAQVYRWKDANGVTVFSQTPPVDGSTADTIDLPRPPEDGPAEAREPEASPAQEVDDYLEDKELAREAKAEEEADRTAREQNCKVAQENLKTLNKGANRLTRMPDGSFTRLTEAQRQEYLKKARETIAADCQ